MYLHRSGLRPGQEQIATHSRRRYRLKQNPSLWLVCYHQADQRDFRPAQTIHLDQKTRQLLAERTQIERNKSQLVRQEFMLHDTAKFPTVSLPGVASQVPFAQQPAGYPGNVMAHMSRGQYNPYLQHQQQAVAAQAAQAGLGPSPSKRPRPNSMAHAPVSATSIPRGPTTHPGAKQVDLSEEVMEENESTGADLMDILTPREIALDRYVKHHEWLEEILSSPFDTHRIVPSELGLGRKGELESLTGDFFDAPSFQEHRGRRLKAPGNVTREKAESNQPVVEEVPIARVGKLEGSKAKDFTKRATERVAAINAEMEILKKQHAKRLAKLNRGFAYKEAEQKVRVATLELINGEAEEVTPAQAKEIEELQSRLEQNEGKHIGSVATVECTDKGGQEEVQQKSAEEPQEPQDFDMTGTDTFDLDGAQLQTPSDLSAHRDAVDEQPSPRNDPVPAFEMQAEPEPPQVLQSGQTQSSQQPPETAEVATEDYVMISKEDVAAPEANEPINPPESLSYPEGLDQDVSGEGMPDFGDAQQESFEPADFGGDSIDFGDMDTAGEELSGYAQEIANMGAEPSGQSDIGLNSPPAASPLPDVAAPSEQSHQPGL